MNFPFPVALGFGGGCLLGCLSNLMEGDGVCFFIDVCILCVCEWMYFKKEVINVLRACVLCTWVYKFVM